MKVSSLAREAGVSEQQVRNYLAAGLLPPAERAANNYRVFTAQHADALRTVRAFARGHGWKAAHAVLGSVHSGDIAAALAVVDEGHAALARERATVAAATEAFTRVADRPAPAVQQHVRVGEVAARVGVRPPVLRLWERRGLLRPDRQPHTGHRAYGPAEQRAAHLVAVLRAGGFGFGIIEDAIAAMRASGGVTQALTQLARRDEQLRRQSLLRMRGTAALHAYLAAYYSEE
ncbi:MerR family transcriptional regulator [Virgisporangium aliadipatigenens]|uniref:MerR family transcriptional regulator n=1 Tax=Virgisporangium aliadipatigenens TaxID=741659 RepID=A0A8J3YMW8_9ACTN|nr:MerR family transcriptional regulator [Virgisporangium aliadipatigenens]GIJ46785.1 MerR family transcriptional regulator [Virgisporangium aliadipatigenens]